MIKIMLPVSVLFRKAPHKLLSLSILKQHEDDRGKPGNYPEWRFPGRKPGHPGCITLKEVQPAIIRDFSRKCKISQFFSEKLLTL